MESAPSQPVPGRFPSIVPADDAPEAGSRVATGRSPTSLGAESHPISGDPAGPATRPSISDPPALAGPEPQRAEGVSDRLEAAILGLETVRQRPRTASLVVLAALTVAGIAWWLGRPPPAQPIELALPMAAGADSPGSDGPSGEGTSESGTPEGTETGADPDSTVSELIVHVAGAVEQPGIVRLAPGSRVVDAVDAAGGAGDDADLHQLNLAAQLVDGSQIRVPAVGEVVVHPLVRDPSADSGPGAGDGGHGTALVDINRAGSDELQRLPGIGPALAEAIIDWRAENGPFGRIDDLLDVSGIGPAKLDALADQVIL
jgi:competence protein ComEA